MRRIHIPRALHEVFGESQTAASLAAIVVAGAAGCLAVLTLDDVARSGVAVAPRPAWRLVLGALLAFDVAAGAVANFTRGTSDFYATRPGLRWTFIAVHIHLPAAAALFGWPLAPVLGLWGYTIAGASAVNALHGSDAQVPVAGGLLALGLGLAIAVPAPPAAARLLAALFLLKVLYAFPVDHYRSDPGHGAA